jgi:cytidylate kinase
VRRWEAERRAARERERPCVAISRLPHCGATAIGRLLAGELGYGFFGREIIEQIARERGIQERLVEGLDERVRSTLDRFVADAFRRRAFDESHYLRDVTRIITALGEGGGAVVLGRGAPYILPAARALRVLFVAPAARRAGRLAAAAGLDREEATARLAEEDERRRSFLLRQFGVRQEDPLLYDIVLDTAGLSTEDAAAIVMETLRRRFPTARVGKPTVPA